MPHAGGVLFAENSRAATLLNAWICAGAPEPIKDEPTTRKLFVIPDKRSMTPGETQRLLVIAEDDKGTRRDVTWLSRFESNDAGMASVDPNGLVKVRRSGETAVRASFQGIVSIAAITSPYPNSVDPARFAVKNNAIDDHVFAKLAALRIDPSDLAGDAEFLRLAFLDTIGTLPTPAEARAFLSDNDPAKRSKLIDRLLDRPEYVDLWTQELADLFQNRKERDHDVRSAKGVRAFHSWLRAGRRQSTLE